MTSMFAHNFQTSIDWARCATGKRLRPSCAMDLTRLSTSQPRMAGILLNSPLLSRPEVGSIKTVKTSPDYSASPTQQTSCCGRCRALRTSVTTIAMNPYGHQGTTDSLIARPYLPESKVGTSMQWPEVYDLCHTFLHVEPVKTHTRPCKNNTRFTCDFCMEVIFLLEHCAKMCDKILYLGPLPGHEDTCKSQLSPSRGQPLSTIS